MCPRLRVGYSESFDSCAPAHLKLAPSPTRSLLPSQFYLLCRFSQKLHSTSRFCPSMSLASPRLHSFSARASRNARSKKDELRSQMFDVRGLMSDVIGKNRRRN